MLGSIGGNPRYRGENIMRLNLDHPAREGERISSTYSSVGSLIDYSSVGSLIDYSSVGSLIDYSSVGSLIDYSSVGSLID